MNESVEMKGRVWVEVEGIRSIGLGKVQLMELIQNHGSISQAAKAMNMSYRKAWLLIEELNQISGKPAVLTQKGGHSGGEHKVWLTARS
jgi:molybdate transport system regulatory protein